MREKLLEMHNSLAEQSLKADDDDEKLHCDTYREDIESMLMALACGEDLSDSELDYIKEIGAYLEQE